MIYCRSTASGNQLIGVLLVSEKPQGRLDTESLLYTSTLFVNAAIEMTITDYLFDPMIDCGSGHAG